MSELEKLTEAYVRDALRKATQDIVAKHVGWGIDDGVKQCLREAAIQMINEDPELRQMMREKLLYWLNEKA